MTGVEITIFGKGEAHKIEVSEDGIVVGGELYYWQDIKENAITVTTDQGLRVQLECMCND